ncbi:MAG TPA: polysaccharide deacetylase family protein [Gammaproteobacteria bacterium]|nr:polysaccharide deacetylase family protein [Gammaproteobacteria bacterium]
MWKKKIILIIFYYIMTCLGVIKLFYWLNRKKRLILTYHNIIPDDLFDHTYHLGVSHSESIFKNQIKLISRRFSYNLKEKKMFRCVITFDDGYKNQMEIAARILNSYDLKGLFFISFQSLISGRALIIDRVMMWISYVPVGEYNIIGNLTKINDENRSLIASTLYDHLIKNYKLWDEIEENLNNSFEFNRLTIDPHLARLRFKPLTADDLKKLVYEGHLIGAHSWSHRPLSRLPIEIQKEDFLKCRLLVKKHCNSLLYSYPFGGIQEVSPITTKLCEECGFSAAYMNIPEAPLWLDVNADYILPRLSLPNESNKYLINGKLSGFEFFCKKIINYTYMKIKFLRLFYNAKKRLS